MGTILFFLAWLGIVMVVIGIFRLVMTILNIKPIQDLENKLEIKLNKLGFNITTRRLGLVIIVSGFIMTIMSCAFCAWPQFGLANEVHRKILNTPRIAPLKEDGYAISEEEIRIDLRGRKELGASEFFGCDLSETKRTVKIVIRDVGHNVAEVNFRHATSGYAIMPIDKDAKWRTIEKKSDEIYNPFFSLVRGDISFSDLIKRRGRMTSYYMSVPVAKGENRQIVYALKYYNAYQGKEFEWTGKVVSADTEIITMYITFPENKPFMSFETYKKDAADAPMIVMDAPEIETAPDNRMLTWVIREAKEGEKYYIKWLW